jgi:hypothetical protein
VVVRTNDVRCDDTTRASLLRLGAAVEIDNVACPAPKAPIEGLAELVGGLIATHVVMASGVSLLEDSARECCVEWMRHNFISGLCLRVHGEPADAGALFNAVRELEDLLGDVVVVNMPGDEVLLGNSDCGWLASETTDESLRREYVRWRIRSSNRPKATIPGPKFPRSRTGGCAPWRISCRTHRSCSASAQDHPLASAPAVDLRRLANERFIMYSPELGGGLHDLCIAVCKEAGFTPKGDQEARTVPVAVSFAAAGVGVVLVPASVQNIHTPGVVYRPLRQARAQAELAITHRVNDRSPRVKEFVKVSLGFRARAAAK